MINHYVAFYHKIPNKNVMSFVKMKYMYVYGSYHNPHGFRVVLSLSLFDDYFGWAHKLSHDMFFPQSCLSHDSHKQSQKTT